MTWILHQGASNSWARDFVEMRATSHDGTSIGFLRSGSGPGLLLVQGAMGSVANYRRIAQLLARNFTVHLPDRRGRGMSRRPYSAAHDIGRDVEDLEAVSDASNVRFVFGLSSGAMIALEAAKRLPTLSERPSTSRLSTLKTLTQLGWLTSTRKWSAAISARPW